MHRVELKGDSLSESMREKLVVPNAPCGVERSVILGLPAFTSRFLMHRVELKAQTHEG